MYFFLKYIVTLFYKKLRIKIVVSFLCESGPRSLGRIKSLRKKIIRIVYDMIDISNGVGLKLIFCYDVQNLQYFCKGTYNNSSLQLKLFTYGISCIVNLCDCVTMRCTIRVHATIIIIKYTLIAYPSSLGTGL